MFKLIIKWIIFALFIMLTGIFIPGITVENFLAAMIFTVILVLINAVIMPILKLFTLPINMATLGVFSLVLNALLLMLSANFIEGIAIDGFISAIIYAIVISIFSAIITKI